MNISTFNAFKSRNYRLYFTGQSISLVGTWMQKTAVSWVVYDLTHSEFMLGLSLFASMFPSFLFSFLGGVAADRYDSAPILHVQRGCLDGEKYAANINGKRNVEVFQGDIFDVG